MSELTNRIRKHNSWRRGEHDDMCNAMQLRNDLDALSNDLDKLTDQNKMLRDALVKVVSADSFHYQDDAEFAEAINNAKDILEQTKC